VGVASNPREYHYHPIAEDRLVLITANKEPYLSMHRSGTSGLELLDRPMILREENSGTRQEMERYLLRNQIPPESLNIIAQIDNPEAIRSSVSRGLGVSVMSVLAAREYLQSGQLLSFELGDQGAFRKIYLCWRKDALLSPSEKKFIRFIQERSLVTAEI
jgi:DNA-binding transcriptional LysR family regulator